MSDESNENNRVDPNLGSLDLASVRHFIDLVQAQHQREIKGLENKIDTKIGSLSEQIVGMHVDLKDHISSIENKANSKFDTVDTALRGNGRIGVFEQIRSIKVKQRVIGIVLILLLGAKVWGYTLDDWFDATFLGKDNAIEQKEGAEIRQEPQEISVVLVQDGEGIE